MHAPYDVYRMTLVYLSFASKRAEFDKWLGTMGSRMCQARTVLSCIAHVPDNLGFLLLFFVGCDSDCWKIRCAVVVCVAHNAHVLNKYAENVTMYEVILNVLNQPILY